MAEPSNYIVYVDESGDHGLSSIDPNYPIFVLAFCVFEKRMYIESVVPQFQELKFEFVGHDCVVLHERDIRKDTGSMRFLKSPEKKQEFMERLEGVIRASDVLVITAVIDKRRLQEDYGDSQNPYERSLTFCLERLWFFLRDREELVWGDGSPKRTHIVFEARGKREDEQLELAFRRICDGDNYMGKRMPFEFVLADKKINSTGLQIADLIARPIGLSIYRPEQINRAYEVISEKLYRSAAGKVEGFGLKCFP